MSSANAEPAARRIAVPEAFLWVGRLAEYKQPLAFIDLARKFPEARFWMVPTGEDPAAERLRRKIDAAMQGLANFELLPPRPRSKLGPLIDRAVAMVNTSDYEGMPNVFLEAWSRGVPALALSHDPDGVISREGLGGFADGDRERFVDLARRLWVERNYQEDLALRCLNYTNREHAPGVLAARWAAVLGLITPDTTPVHRVSQRDPAV
jgi:glycosyltransferase involved in cell wall biosynthesis